MATAFQTYNLATLFGDATEHINSPPFYLVIKEGYLTRASTYASAFKVWRECQAHVHLRHASTFPARMRERERKREREREREREAQKRTLSKSKLNRLFNSSAYSKEGARQPPLSFISRSGRSGAVPKRLKWERHLALLARGHLRGPEEAAPRLLDRQVVTAA